MCSPAARAHIVEIGSGSGQHVHAYAEAMPDLVWWPTDISPRHLESIDAWRAQSEAQNLMPPVALDASASDWEFGTPGRPPAENLTAMFSANVVHISPIRGHPTVVFSAAGRHLGPDGLLLFLWTVQTRRCPHRREQRARFDASLRAENPEWGVRDTADLQVLASENGLELRRMVDMPANNFILVFARQTASRVILHM